MQGSLLQTPPLPPTLVDTRHAPRPPQARPSSPSAPSRLHRAPPLRPPSRGASTPEGQSSEPTLKEVEEVQVVVVEEEVVVVVEHLPKNAWVTRMVEPAGQRSTR